MPTDYPATFAALRALLSKHAKGLRVIQDTDKNFTVVTPATAPNKKPMWFAAVMIGKSAVAFHLLPLYFNPKLNAQVHPDLLKRKQGKACFNFQREDKTLFAHLDALTATALEHFRAVGFLKEGQITKEQMNAALIASGEDPKKIAAKRKKTVTAANAKRAATLKSKR